MRRIRWWSPIIQNTILMNSSFILGIIPPSYPRAQHWEASTSISLIANAAVTDVHRPGSEPCTFTSHSFSPYVTFTIFAITDFFLNFIYQCLVQYKSTRAVTPSSDGQPLSVASHSLEAAALSLPSLWRACGQGPVKWHPWKSSGPTPRKASQGFSSMRMRCFLCFVSLIFFPSLMVGSPFFQSRWTVVMSTTVASQARETPSVLFFFYDQ